MYNADMYCSTKVLKLNVILLPEWMLMANTTSNVWVRVDLLNTKTC